jgi:hypothetical protein
LLILPRLAAISAWRAPDALALEEAMADDAETARPVPDWKALADDR